MSLEREFDDFVRARGDDLLRAARVLTGDWPAAEDLAQTALERAWPKWGRLADDAHRFAYVHRVMTNAFLRERGRRWRGEIATETVPEPTAQDDDLAGRNDLMNAIGRLPAGQRAVITLRYLADLSERQTAEAMHCTVGTVKRYNARALAALRADGHLIATPSEETAP